MKKPIPKDKVLDCIIETKLEHFRDPFILVEDGIYYVYGTKVDADDWENSKWACYVNKSGELDGEWLAAEGKLYVVPENAVKNFWSPEVHKYNGAYYMFATYYSSATNHRGCSILKADNPLGPFVEITNGHITPRDWDALDGTLYVDDENQPWMVFCHEWTSMDDGVGRMAVAKLSEDFTHFISEPTELFKANDPSWTHHIVTDGCFVYTAKDGQLLMLWSNCSDYGYCVGVARSKNGKIDGEWEHDEEILFSSLQTGEHDGGCGIIFTALDGKVYLSAHSPNLVTEERGERLIFIPIYEENGKLICGEKR